MGWTVCQREGRRFIGKYVTRQVGSLHVIVGHCVTLSLMQLCGVACRGRPYGMLRVLWLFIIVGVGGTASAEGTLSSMGTS